MALDQRPQDHTKINEILNRLSEKIAGLCDEDRQRLSPDLALLQAEFDQQKRQFVACNQEVVAYKQAIEQPSQLVNDVLASITDAFYAVNSNWRITYANQRAIDWWRRPKEELIGKVLWDLFPMDETVEGYQVHLQTMQERVPRRFETFSPNLNTWVDVSIYPAQNGGLSVYFQDITARKQAEQTLRVNQQELSDLAGRFKAVLEYSLDVPYRRDLRTDQYDYMSSAVKEMLGFTAEEMKMMSIDEVMARIHPDDRPVIEAALAQAIEDGAGKLEYRFTCKDGTERWFGDHITITKDTAGNPTYRTGVMRDITGRKQGEEALQRALAEAEEGHLLLETLLENIPEGIAITGGPPDFKMKRVSKYGLALTQNPAASALIGLPTSQHQNIWDIYAVDGKTRPKQSQMPLYRASQNGEIVQNEEFSMKTRDGDMVPILVNAVPIRSAQGKVVGAIYTWRDIAERKLSEMAIRRQNAVLAGINRIFHQAIAKESEEKLGLLCLEVAEEITQSQFGFIAEIDPKNGKLKDIAISDLGWDEGRMEIKKLASQKVLSNFEIHGTFGRALLDGKGFYTNDPASHPDWIGIPSGHPELASFLGVPLFYGGKLFGMVGMANREGGYSSEALESLEALSPAISQALLSKRAEQALRDSEERERQRANELQTLMDGVPAMIWISHNPDCREITGNRYVYELLQMESGSNISKSDPAGEQANQHYELEKNGKAIATTELPLQVAAATGIPQVDYTLDLVVKNGKTYNLVGNANPLFDREGKPAGAVGVFMNVSELRKLEAEQVKARTNIEVQRRLMDQREQERLGIARDLHDGPIQTLSSTVFYLQAIKDVFDDPALQVELNEVGSNIKNAMRELRTLLYDLRPPTLMHFGFSRIVQVSLEEFHERHPEIELNSDVMEDGRQLPDDTRLGLFRIFQAGIDNILLHSHATRVSILYKLWDDRFQLELHDNGQGFQTPEDYSQLTQTGHFGLVGMTERAEAIGATLSICSSTGKGTSIAVTGPIQRMKSQQPE